jgi:hypothetical protein
MEKAGFKVEMQSMDWQTLVARRAKKDPPTAGGWHAFLTSWASVDILDPVAASFLNASCDKATFGWPCDAEIERPRDAFAKETDPEKQKAIAEAVQRGDDLSAAAVARALMEHGTSAIFQLIAAIEEDQEASAEDSRERIREAIEEFDVGNLAEQFDRTAGPYAIGVRPVDDADDASPVDDGDAVGERHGLLVVLGDIEHSRSCLAQEPRQFEAHLEAQLGVDIAQRVVEQQKLGR